MNISNFSKNKIEFSANTFSSARIIYEYAGEKKKNRISNEYSIEYTRRFFEQKNIRGNTNMLIVIFQPILEA